MAKASLMNDPDYWRNRAKERRDMAEGFKDIESRRTMLRIADDYDRLAARAEQRQKGALNST
jgi:hypothetical protein